MIYIINRKIHLSSESSDYDVVIRTISGKPVGQIPSNAITDLKREIGKPDELSFIVPKHYIEMINITQKNYPLFNEIKNERQILLDKSEVYSIKVIEQGNDETIKVVAKSREIRLSEIDITIEDCGFMFFKEDLEDNKNQILSLDKYLYDETGWSLGEVTDIVRYQDIDTKEDTLRWFENADKKWYDFIKDDICESFNCMCSFDTLNKKINFFREEELGNDVGLYLSKDNYIKDMARISDSDKIITRMKVIGNEEMDIIGSVCTGEPFIENYSYFMKNNEMSEELINALETYYEVVEKRETQWKKLVDERQEKLREKKILGTTFIDAEAQITALKNVRDTYSLPPKSDEKRVAQLNVIITEKTVESQNAQNKIDFLDKEIDDLNKAVDNLMELCKKPTATDDNGKQIFNKELLDELKEYIYTETYKNDSFLTENVDELIELAKRKLREKAKPTYKWDLDVVNFLNRLEPIDRLSWSGSLGLGDLVILYDKDTDTEEFVYFIGYKHSVQENNMEITLSNKKTEQEDGLTIADYLTGAKNSMREFDAKKYLLIQQKYNRLNLPREYIAKYKEEERKRPDGIVID